jgi:hypothetical protein
MSKKALHRAYDRLTPEERFRLDVLATARGDLEESERLTRTCQRETYTMNHRGYTGRWTGAYEITLRMYIAVNNELAKLQMVDAFRELVPYLQTLSHNMIFEGYFCGHESGSRYAWGRAGKDGEPPGYEEDIEESEENADPATEADMDGLEATACEYLGVPPGGAGQAGALARLRRLEPVGRLLRLLRGVCRRWGREDRGCGPGAGRRPHRGSGDPRRAPGARARRGDCRKDTRGPRRELARCRREGRVGVGLRGAQASL